MKFVRYNGGRTGLVVGSDALKIIDVIGSLPTLAGKHADAAKMIASVLPSEGPQHWQEMIGNWDSVREAFATLELRAEDGSFDLIPFEDAKLEPPLASPTIHIFSVSSNTAVHVQHAMRVVLGKELTMEEVMQPKNDGLPPKGFTIWPSSVVGHEDQIIPPKSMKKLDYECECAVYVKTGGRNLENPEMWGYAAWNDLGLRDLNLGLKKEGPWTPFSMNLVKNFDTANSCGPWVVVDEGHDIYKLQCRLTVNGEERQNWNLADMIYSFEEMTSYASEFATIRPGDMLTSGTGAGVAIEGGIDGPGWLKPGDVIEITIDGGGTLRNTVGDWDMT